MPQRFVVVASSSAEPVTLSEAKTHLVVDGSDDNTYIGNLVTAARLRAETFCGRSFINKTVEMKADRFPPGDSPIEFDEQNPIVSVTSIKYTDGDNTTQTFSSTRYTLDNSGDLPRILLNYDEDWPTDLLSHPNSAVVRAVVGYSTASTAHGNPPEDVKHAIKIMTEDVYDYRGTNVTGTIVTEVKMPMSAKNLLWQYRVKSF